MKEENYTIYLHKNKINNKVYIGQTSLQPEKRWLNGRGYVHCTTFYNAIKKYGWNNFEHIILKTNLTSEEANYWEEYYIKKYNSTNNMYGYNIRGGGNDFSFNEEIREKMKRNHADVSGRNNPMYGKKHSQEAREKMRIAATGRKWSKETKKKMSKSTSGGKNHNAKAIYCFELDMSFPSYTEACNYIGLKSKASLSAHLNGYQQSAGKHPITGVPLHWKFI